MSKMQKTCERKKRYYTFTSALKDMIALKKSFPKDHFKIYNCPICNYLHIGHDVDRYQQTKPPQNELFLRCTSSVEALPPKKKPKKVKSTDLEFTFEPLDEDLFIQSIEGTKPLKK